ncbi:hypothetical protein [Litchfieldia alkalitelluris]|uniref:hypothetical protein n=1 Tax=Litchfieldia alkalitelluris TaxID=304268 RepID=UPI000996553F|nr:hypothetical protein [Litchfieldia alkalitelluris]
MEDLEKKINELELRIDELESQQKNMEDSIKQQLDDNDIRVIVDELFEEKDNATKRDVDLELNKYQLKFIKWLIGTGVSVVAIAVTFVRFFLL